MYKLSPRGNTLYYAQLLKERPLDPAAGAHD